MGEKMENANILAGTMCAMITYHEKTGSVKDDEDFKVNSEIYAISRNRRLKRAGDETFGLARGKIALRSFPILFVFS